METVSPATPRTSLTGPFSPEGPSDCPLGIPRQLFPLTAPPPFRMWPPHMLWAPGRDRLAVSDVWSLLSPPLRSTARTQTRRMGPCSKQSDRSDGHQQEKGVHCTRPQAGHPPLDSTLSGSQRRAGSRHHLPHVYQPVAHSLQVELSASLPHVPSLLVLPRPEGRAQSPYTLPPLPRTFPGLGFFCRFGAGPPTWAAFAPKP